MGNNIENGVHGFKVFNPDWTCWGFQYEVGKTYEMDGQPVCCGKGFHFCLDAADSFNYYAFDPRNKVAEVYAFGRVDYSPDGTKCCTDKMKVIREIPWDEVLRIVNTGKGCTGIRNTGDRNTGNRNTGNRNTGNWNTGNRNTGNRNTGNWNTGDWNTGNRNTGDWNTGDRNTGDRNTGNWNTGDRNTGDWNTGNCNTGNCNTGDWNQSSFNTGCFMTQEQKICMFNKPSGWAYKDWLESDAKSILEQMPKKPTVWVYSEDMTDGEKAGDPSYKTTGGFLKALDESGCAQMWWDGLAEDKKSIIKKMPNFDAEIFRQCTGIDTGRK